MRRVAAFVSVLLWAAAAPAQPAAPVEPPPTVAVDLASLTGAAAERIDALGLESRIVSRLLQEGFTVASPFASPDVTVRAEEVAQGIRLVATGAGGEEVTTVLFGNGTRSELQLEISQKVVGLVRARVAAVLAAREKARQPPPPGPLHPPPPEPPPPPPLPPPSPRFSLSVGAGGLWRGPVLDPQLFVLLGLQGRGLFGVGTTLAMDGSAATGGHLQVFEWQATVGPRMDLLRVGRWSASVGVEVGVAFYGAWQDGVYVQDENKNPRLDVLAVVPVNLRFEPTDWLQLGIRLSPGIAGRSHTYLLDGDVIWHSELARLEGGAWVGLAF